MTIFGLIDAIPGFRKKTFSEILASIEAKEKADISAALDVSADGPIGQFNGVFTQETAEAWDVLQDIHSARDPNNSEGAALDALLAITGAARLQALPSTFKVSTTNPITLTGDPTTVIGIGSQMSVTGTGDAFSLDAGVVLPAALAAWTPTTAYVVGDRRTNSGNAYEVEIAGTSAGAGGPTTTDPLTPEVDGTVTWRFMGVGTAALDTDATALLTGPTAANAFVVTTIDTPVSGWNGVTNLKDVTLGRNIETNEAARIRRDALLRQTGKATLEAVRAAVLGVTLVTEAIVFENTSLITDPSGIPGKAFEAVVLGGADADLRQAIFDTKPIGIEAHGDISGSVVDSQGISHTIEFSRPTAVPIFMAYTLVTDGNYPLDGDTQVKNAAKAIGDALNIGDDVIFELFKCAAFDIAGVVDITSFFIDTSGPAAGTSNIAILVREIATFDTGDITVSS